MHLSRQLNCWSLRCSWSIACWRCSNYIFILHLTSGFNILRKTTASRVEKNLSFGILVCLILEILRYIIIWTKYIPISGPNSFNECYINLTLTPWAVIWGHSYISQTEISINVTVVHLNHFQGTSPWHNQFREAAGSVPNGLVARGNMGLLSQWISRDFCPHEINIVKLHTALLQFTKKSYTHMITADMWSTMKLSILVTLIWYIHVRLKSICCWFEGCLLSGKLTVGLLKFGNG